MSPLLNYTTTVPVCRTVGAIHELLAKAGATQIMTTYGPGGRPTGVSFAIATSRGPRGFALPVRVEPVHAVMRRDRATPPRYKTPEQAERVAWRIAKDWLEAQLAIVATEMVSLEQVMLPYMHVDGRTLYELFVADELPTLGPGLAES